MLRNFLDRFMGVTISLVDDDINKQGLFMPGTRLPICSSSALLERDIELCLLGINPDIEEKIIANHSGFRDRGGVFQSIYPNSKRTLGYA